MEHHPTIPLSGLRFGNDPEAPAQLNARKTDKMTGVAGLAETIRYYINAIPGHHGLVQPLTVVRHNGHAFTADGDRRLAALQRLAKEGAIAPDHPVPVLEQPLEQALSMSMTTSITPQPKHPIDLFEAFDELVLQGMSEEDIAQAYCFTATQVRQFLALGQLSPMIRRKWREGVIDQKDAEAFTLARDPEQQEAIYERIEKEWNRAPAAWRVREILIGNAREATRLIKFVGEDAYRQEGGSVIKDLFSDSTGVSDFELLEKLATDRLEHERQKLLDAGWAWASTRDEEPNYYSYRYVDRERDYTPSQIKKIESLKKKIEACDDDDDKRWDLTDELRDLEDSIPLKPLPADAMGGSGCLIGIGRDGELEVDEGYIRPGESRQSKDKGAGKSDEKPKAPTIPHSLHQRLTQQLTHAVGAAIANDPNLALALVATALASTMRSRDAYQWGTDAPPICLFEQGMDRRLARYGAEKKRASFETLLPEMIKGGAAHQKKVLTEIAARAVDMERTRSEHSPIADKAAAALIEALNPKAFGKCVAETFDPNDYFQTVSKTLAVKAVEEALGAERAGEAAKLKKSDLADLCIREVPKTGWLPTELRTVHYDGPGAVKAKSKSKKPARKKAA